MSQVVSVPGGSFVLGGLMSQVVFSSGWSFVWMVFFPGCILSPVVSCSSSLLSNWYFVLVVFCQGFFLLTVNIFVNTQQE